MATVAEDPVAQAVVDAGTAALNEARAVIAELDAVLARLHQAVRGDADQEGGTGP